MCIIISDPYTVTENIEVYKLCRLEGGKELRSQFEPDLRAIAARKEVYPPLEYITVKPGEGGKDILYRHRDDIGKRILITDEHPGFCIFKSPENCIFKSPENIKLRCQRSDRILKCIIPAGAKIYDIGHFMDFHHNGYATNMLEINCNDPWPA